MNRSYRTVWNACLGACVAVAENASAPRGRARGTRRAIGASAVLAVATLAASGVSQAATFAATNEAELITAINQANASTDPSSTITLTAAITATSALPALNGNVTITTNANLSTTIGSAAGASLELQGGADYVGSGLLGRVLVGSTANTTGTLTLRGSGTTLSTIALRGFSGQSNINVLDGAIVTITSGTGNGVFLGGTAAGAYNGGSANVVVSGAGSAILAGSQYLQQAGTLAISNGGTVQAGLIYLGAMTGSVTGMVTGAGSTLRATSGIALGAYGSGTLTVADGGTISSASAITLGGIGAGTGTGTVNIGAAVGDAPGAPGTVIAPAIQGGPGTAVLNFNHNAANYDFAVPITETTNVNQIGSGTTTLTAANTYTGATNVTGGTLRAGAANVFSAASAHTVAVGGTLDLAGFSQTLSSLSNAGVVSLPGSTPGNTLAVTGAYVGNGGTLRLGTALGDSSSASDRLVLSGATASASGNTKIQITNLGGLGALTTGNGIEVVSATGGATTTAQTTKDAFSLAGGYVDAGAYEYRLYAADASGAGENWYLRSSAISVVMDPTMPRGPVPTYRAEVPLYAVQPEQFREFDFAMLGNMHQRVGDERAATGAALGERQAWGRIISTDRDIAQQGTVSPSSSGRLTGFQAGTDLWANSNWRTGLYAGQLEGDMDVSGFARGVVNYAAGHNDLRSQYVGAYATWTREGLYVDSVLQAGRHSYTAYPSLGQSSTGKGDSLVGSIEAGQSFALAPRWVIEPQVQITYQHLSLDDTAISGATIHQDIDGSWMARAGVRVKGQYDVGAGTLQPYVRVNLYKRSSGTDITRFIGPAASTDITSRTGGSSSELAAGATWELSKSTSLYGEVGQLWDIGGDARTSSGVNGSVGVKVLW
ncbi:autotransporter domain-containing protein [Variovorax sp. Sphag1AA]|uniref:autotransporter domain-containing protein n=1 Tax=Variovorax sp. Sphag1AA TaxID=2587027 RepID=UPI00161DB743|nr:autotransporter domain-containing protein [Variovorax sp. Sphag1AA]MBB3179303.1 T5SS/PEP-CTERM-associated repeat protein/autotransporter-associated beta strand protein [Variovorax sp. Sphag1AA]